MGHAKYQCALKQVIIENLRTEILKTLRHMAAIKAGEVGDLYISVHYKLHETRYSCIVASRVHRNLAIEESLLPAPAIKIAVSAWIKLSITLTVVQLDASVAVNVTLHFYL